MVSFDTPGHFDGEDITKARDEGIMKHIKENGEGFDHPNVSGAKALNIFSSIKLILI
jgi:hypothetical protein